MRKKTLSFFEEACLLLNAQGTLVFDGPIPLSYEYNGPIRLVHGVNADDFILEYAHFSPKTIRVISQDIGLKRSLAEEGVVTLSFSEFVSVVKTKKSKEETKISSEHKKEIERLSILFLELLKKEEKG